MRRVSESNGIWVKAYSGTTGVLLAFDIEPEKRRVSRLRLRHWLEMIAGRSSILHPETSRN